MNHFGSTALDVLTDIGGHHNGRGVNDAALFRVSKIPKMVVKRPTEEA